MIISDRLFYIIHPLKACLLILIVTLFYGIGNKLYGQQYLFKNYTVATGLGANSINHIYQDSKGYIWFATQGGGVSKFNGTEFTTYTKLNGLINNDVTYITEDKTGNIWIGTAAGVSVFNGTSFTKYPIPGGVIYCIYCDAKNKIWLATADSGIKVLNYPSARISAPECKDKTPENLTGSTFTIIEDKDGNYWFGTGKGIVKYKNGIIETFYEDKIFFSSCIDNNGALWFGSTTGEVVCVQTSRNGKIARQLLNFRDEFIGSIAIDKKNNLWLASDHALIKYTPYSSVERNSNATNQTKYSKNPVEGCIKRFTENEGLSVNTVQTVSCDYEGNIWVGTLSGGVNVLTSEAFARYTNINGLQSLNVSCICPALTKGEYYVGTNKGLYLFNTNIRADSVAGNDAIIKKGSSNNYFKKIKGEKEWSDNGITSLAFDIQKNLWITAQEGVFILRPSTEKLRLIKRYSKIAGKDIISAQKVIHDSKGNTWIATYGSGVFLIDKSSEKVFDLENHFPSNNILTVFEDKEHNILFGTQDKGLIKYNGNSFIPQSIPISENKNEQQQSLEAVWSITENSKGNLILATGESGICILAGDRTKFISTKDGLSSFYINSIEWDSTENCLWAGSEKGLDKIYFTYAGNVKNIKTYKPYDGFSSACINQNGIFATENGTIYICSIDGLWAYKKSLEAKTTITPKIQLTGIRLFYQPVDWGKITSSPVKYSIPKNLELPYNKNHLTFDIRALTTQEVGYTFQLEGLDKTWTRPEKNNAITYSNIPPGKYVFKAKTITANGLISTETILFPFTVKPPWWRTAWFYLLLSILLISFLLFVIKTRERVLLERNIQLETTVQQRTKVIEQQKQTVEKILSEKEVLLKEIHHRVKNNLQTISSLLMLQSMEVKDDEAKRAIKESQSRVRSIALVHQKLYQTDGLEKVELGGFISELSGQIKSLYDSKSSGVSIYINVPETFLLIDKAIPLGLILNELFTNSFKYAFAKTTSPEIKITLTNLQGENKTRKVKLIYQDNGVGFDYNEISKTSPTLGVELIKLLTEQMGAEMTFTNRVSIQFTFIFGINI